MKNFNKKPLNEKVKIGVFSIIFTLIVVYILITLTN